MLRAGWMGALLALMIGILPASAAEISEGQIARAKMILNLNAEQDRHWPRFAAAVRNFSRENAKLEASGLSPEDKAKAEVKGARRVMRAAAPLIKAMTPGQRQTAATMARAMGYGRLASAISP